MRRQRNLAHRGASGYEYENSRAAFRRAIALEADGVELDVHATRDGGFVVYHDAAIAGAGPISLLSLDDARRCRLPNGEAIPTLADILALMGPHEVWVEVKAMQAAYDDRLLQVLADGPHPDRYAVHSFDHRIIRRLGQRRPDLKRGVLLSAYVLDPVAILDGAAASTLWQEQSVVDDQLVAAVHDAGYELIAWTVNDPGDISRLVQLGVDGLCGNFPDRIRVELGTQPYNQDR
ncbi:MAG TPA: glycerophosphodiester phosphodiesterase [Gemmatimonadales bacterium]|nr:glycerophosphodiester phosphodiesterase [Gemmatimonadales bacterium]